MATLILLFVSSDLSCTTFWTIFPIVTLEVSALTDALLLGTKFTGFSLFSGLAGEFELTALTSFDAPELGDEEGTEREGKASAF